MSISLKAFNTKKALKIAVLAGLSSRLSVSIIGIGERRRNV
jgi:hypothetical protein